MIPLSDSHSAGKFPLWVIAVITANIYIFFLQITAVNPDVFIAQYALIPSLVDLSSPQTLVPFLTSQFLHGGFIHIISNMLFLWVFGDNVESRLGFFLFPLFYLLSGAVGGFTQYIFMPTSDVPMIGASGAIAGVLGGYLAMFPRHTVKTLVPVFGLPAIINVPAYFMLFYWFLTQIFAGSASMAVSPQDIGGIAYFAHIGGFLTGFVSAKLLKQ